MGISLRRFDGRDKMAFNEAQKRAIRHFKGPAMVLAGPGSGKTTVITHRVKALIEERGVDPGSILVITFTKAAAAEMKERFGALTENRYGRVGFGTFHAVFFQILKLAYRYQASDIIREEERTALMRDLGATPFQALRKVILPEIRPGMISGFILAFTLSIDDFAVTIFTIGNEGLETLSTFIYADARKGGLTPELRPLSTIIFVTVLVLLIVINKRAEKSKS